MMNIFPYIYFFKSCNDPAKATRRYVQWVVHVNRAEVTVVNSPGEGVELGGKVISISDIYGAISDIYILCIYITRGVER